MRNFLSCVFLLLFLASTAGAQVSFFPEMLVLSLDKGEVVEKEVLITNHGHTLKAIRLDLDYRIKGRSTRPVKKWAKFSDTEFKLNKSESKKIRLTFTGTGQATSGESVLALFAGEQVNKRITLDIRTGMPVFIRWKKEKRVSGKIIDVRQKQAQDGVFALGIDVQNTGYLHVTPYGIAWVNDSLGKRIWQVELRPNQPIFPGKTAQLNWQGQAAKLIGIQGDLHVQLFWGTLYGIDALGAPKSEKKQMPVKVVAISK